MNQAIVTNCESQSGLRRTTLNSSSSSYPRPRVFEDHSSTSRPVLRTPRPVLRLVPSSGPLVTIFLSLTLDPSVHTTYPRVHLTYSTSLQITLKSYGPYDMLHIICTFLKLKANRTSVCYIWKRNTVPKINWFHLNGYNR